MLAIATIRMNGRTAEGKIQPKADVTLPNGDSIAYVLGNPKLVENAIKSIETTSDIRPLGNGEYAGLVKFNGQDQYAYFVPLAIVDMIAGAYL